MSGGDTDTQDILQRFATDGFCVLRQILPSETVSEWASKYASEDFFDSIFQKLHSRGHTWFPTHCRCDGEKIQYAMGQGVKHGFREIVMRSPGRYEIFLQQGDAVDIINCLKEKLPFVPDMLRTQAHCNDTKIGPLTWKDVCIANASIVVGAPGAATQGWHADGGHVSLHRHEPCHCFNIFIPLSEVTKTSGPTELRPGTHFHTRNLTRFMLAAKARKTLRPPMAPTMKGGDCLIFDYRILHRGLSNTSSGNRAILVIAVAQPWFKDVANSPAYSIYDPPRATQGTTEKGDSAAGAK